MQKVNAFWELFDKIMQMSIESENVITASSGRSM